MARMLEGKVWDECFVYHARHVTGPQRHAASSNARFAIRIPQLQDADLLQCMACTTLNPGAYLLDRTRPLKLLSRAEPST